MTKTQLISLAGVSLATLSSWLNPIEGELAAIGYQPGRRCIPPHTVRQLAERCQPRRHGDNPDFQGTKPALSRLQTWSFKAANLRSHYGLFKESDDMKEASIHTGISLYSHTAIPFSPQLSVFFRVS